MSIVFNITQSMRSSRSAQVLAATRLYLRSRGSRFVSGSLLAIGLLVFALGAGMFLRGYSLNAVTSGSMRPSVQPGDLVVLQRVSAVSLRTGDVIAYMPPKGGEPLLHRIVTLSYDNGIVVMTQGDANQVPDLGPVQLDATAYRLVGTAPLLGWLIELRALIWLLFGAVIVLMALRWARKVVKAKLAS